MSVTPRVLALITARGGSKRLPGKNLRPLAGRPLIQWSIDFARAQPEISATVVSTDDADIAHAARRAGADVPWLRPAELATDTATSADVVVHALNALAESGRSFDTLVLLQPTSPFRDAAMLREALSLCLAAQGAPVVAMGPARTHPAWCFRQDETGRLQRYTDHGANASRSQDLPPAWEITGNLYVVGVARFLAERSFFGADAQGVYSTDRRLSCDIDDDLDWCVAEYLARP